MEIITGKQVKPIKALCYGPEGIGKSTFASQWPNPLFVDVENGTSSLDVSRTPQPSSWTMLKSIVVELTKNAQGFKTLILDTADWADNLACLEVCAEWQKESIGQINFGKGWLCLADKWAKFLDLIAELQKKQGMHVLFLAHAAIRKFELPDEAGAYDRYELKMEKKSASMLKEWSDLMIFANYKTLVVDIDGKKKSQGGQRVMYTSHHSCWDAKNRFGLSEELPFEFKSISKIFNDIPATTPAVPAKTEASAPVPAKAAETAKAPEQPKAPETPKAPDAPAPPVNQKENKIGRPEGIPDTLWDLMIMSGVTGEEVQKAVHAVGAFPVDTPIKNYGEEFIAARLVGKWDKVVTVIEKIRATKTK